MIFDIDTAMVLDAVTGALENSAADVSEEQFYKICDAIEKGMPGVIGILTRGMAEHWKSEAEKAGGWGTKYAPAIQYKINKSTGEVYLDESILDAGSNKPNFMFAMMMEKGVTSWSIKDALLASEKVKVSSEGIKYIIVPFPVSTPRKNSSMKQSKQFGKREMTQEIYNIVKAGGRMPVGATLNVNGKEVDVGGLTKYNTQKYHDQYGFFRCVTERSEGWQYPDKSPRPIFPTVLAEINKQISEIISEFLTDIVKEYGPK
jgi:hypothetical protein